MNRPILRWVAVLVIALIAWVALIALSLTIVQLRVPINLPSSQIFANAQSLRVTGTWVIEGEKQAFPLQTTEIFCIRGEKQCTAASSQIMSGDQMIVDLSFYEVASWEKGRVVLIDSSPGCVEYVYTIDSASKVAYGVRRKKTNTTDALGVCSHLNGELRLTLKSGLEVTRKLNEEAMPWYGHLVLAPLKAFF